MIFDDPHGNPTRVFRVFYSTYLHFGSILYIRRYSVHPFFWSGKQAETGICTHSVLAADSSFEFLTRELPTPHLPRDRMHGTQTFASPLAAMIFLPKLGHPWLFAMAG